MIRSGRAVLLAVLAGSLLAGCADAPLTSPPVTPTPVTAPVTADYRVEVPAIGVSSTLIPLGLAPNRTVEVPPVENPGQAGVYSRGPVPGDVGPAVILGHVNGGGRPGVFARLSTVRTGDTIQVRRPDGRTVTFLVYRVRTVQKSEFPTAEVYSDTPGSELRLVTCGGTLDREARSYRSNVIVFASLVST